MRHRLLGLYAFAALGSLVPLWSVDHLPTTDGPSHLYNASVLRHLVLGTGDHPLYAEHYEVDRRPMPNWATHASLAVLMGVASPAVAEKLLASAIVLAFLAGAWALVAAVRPGGAWPAFLAFPFAYHQLFQWGFYNFALGLGLYLLAVGLWWRWRDRAGWRPAAVLNAVLLLTWFAHLLPFALALATIGVLWLVTLPARPRRHLLPVALLAPQVALPLWWLLSSGSGGVIPDVWGPAKALRFLLELGILHTFDPVQLRVGAALAVLFALLVGCGLWRALRSRTLPRADDAFLLLAALLLAAYFLAPEGFADGTLLKQRLSLFPILLLLPWLAARVGDAGGPRVRRLAAGALAALALANAAFVTCWYRTLDREVAAFLTGLAAAPADTRGLALVFQPFGTSSNTTIHGHAFDRVALPRGIVDWGNYEARTSHFPVRFRPGIETTPLYVQEARPLEFPVARYRRIVDFIYTWRMPAEAPVARRIGRNYRLAGGNGDGQLWIRKRRGPGPPGAASPAPRSALRRPAAP